MEKAIAAVGADNIATTRLSFLRIFRAVRWLTGRKHTVSITSYMTLAYGNALKDEVIAHIAAKHNATPGAGYSGMGNGGRLLRNSFFYQT